jgi:hypothetical protein
MAALTSAARSAYTQLLYGQATDRAAAVLPQTATGTLFTIAGGRVILRGLVGEVTVALGATVTSAKIVHTPTVGVVGDCCAAGVITSLGLGSLLTLTGVLADLLNVVTFAGSMCSRDLVLPVGALGLNTTASNTGSVKWRAFWLPLDVGATVTAA